MSISAASITARLAYFQSLVSKWESRQPAPLPFPSSVDTLKGGSEREGKDVVVALRTRPSLDSEIKRFQPDDVDTAAIQPSGEDGVASPFCTGITVRSAEPGVMVAHVPGMKWNGPTLLQKKFDADLAFAPDIGNEEVYKRTIDAQNMLELVLGGGVGCVLAYGQTGSGKTYTMEALESSVARDIFPLAQTMSRRLRESVGEVFDPDQPVESVFEFRVTFLELLGKTATDLVERPGQTPEKRKVDIAENKSGSVRPPLEETLVKTSAELQSLISSSLSHRRVSATARNARSSRSHAILTIWVKNILVPYADEGQLILVDLAGSERYEDSKHHDKATLEESRENNTSLSNLKDCVRARAKAMDDDQAFVHIPYRSNRLTLLLKPIFDLESTQLSKTIVIAHVSPHLHDSAHSVSTLSYASPFKVSIPKRKGPKSYDPKDPRTWDTERTVAWLYGEFLALARKRAGVEEAEVEIDPVKPNIVVSVDPTALCPSPKGGKHLSRLYCGEWVTACLEASVVKPLDKDKQIVVTKDALEVYCSFGLLWSLARTRTRKAVLTNRNILSDEDLGDAPIEWTYLEGPVNLPNTRFDISQFERVHGTEHQARVRDAMAKAKASGLDEIEAKIEVERAALEGWRKEHGCSTDAWIPPDVTV